MKRLLAEITVLYVAAMLLAAGAAGCAKKPTTRPAGGAASSGPAVEAASWPIFRGDAALSGAAGDALPDEPALLWKFKTGDAVKSSPVLAGGKVFIGSDDGNVYALSLADGRKLWAFQTEDAVEAPPLVADGRIYVGSADGNLYCLDRDGKLKWKYRTGDRILGAANVVRLKDRKAPGGWATRIVVGSYDQKLHCVAADEPKAVWTFQSESWINGSPAVSEGRIVFGGCDASVHVVSAADGKPLAAVEAGSYIAASPALAGNECYVGQFEGKCLRIDLASGTVVWAYGEGRDAFFSCPALAADRVVIGCRDRNVHCIARKDGRKLWTFATGGDVDSSPVVCGGKVVVGSQDGRLYILGLADGAKLWSYDIGGAITSSPAVAAGMIVIGCQDGSVYAFGAQGTK